MAQPKPKPQEFTVEISLGGNVVHSYDLSHMTDTERQRVAEQIGNYASSILHQGAGLKK